MDPSTQTNPNPTNTEGRDACGRFEEGNPGGPGNPYPRRAAALRQAMLNSVTEEDMMAITKAVIEEARAGNVAAAKLLFQYLLGKPGSATDMGWAEIQSIQAQGLQPLAARIISTAPPAPKGNGSNGKADEAKSPAAPKANGSNGGIPTAQSVGAPSGLGRQADQWLDRQVRRAMETLSKEPLVNGL